MKAYSKFFVAVSAALAVAASVTADGTLTLNDVVAIISAAVGSLAVYYVPNQQS